MRSASDRESRRCAATPGLGKPTEEAREDAHHIPQQGVVGRMMNVGLHHRGVDPQPMGVSRPAYRCKSIFCSAGIFAAVTGR
jgi:hypothetical protein